LKTSCFFNYAAEGRISIARFPPRGTRAGFRIYRFLAPGPWFNSVDRDEYERRYSFQLARLHPKEVWDELHALVFPFEPILLCWERPPITKSNWCHRCIVAAWFASKLNITVDELDQNTASEMPGAPSHL
jgi:hypothetical protein